MSEPEKITPEEMERLRAARRAYLSAQIAQEQAALELRRATLEVSAAHACEPEQIGGMGLIKRSADR